MTAIILAGGKSSRMGCDKAFIEIEGLPVIKRQLSKLRKIFNKIIIVTDNSDKYKFKAVKVVPDNVIGVQTHKKFRVLVVSTTVACPTISKGNKLLGVQKRA